MDYIFAALHCYEDRQTDRQETDRQETDRRTDRQIDRQENEEVSNVEVIVMV